LDAGSIPATSTNSKRPPRAAFRLYDDFQELLAVAGPDGLRVGNLPDD